MPKILPDVLRRLRLQKGWSLDELAEKTAKKGQGKINRQTIHRLENGSQAKTRERTRQQLAHALNVEPAVLTGEVKLPETQDDSSTISLMSKLGLRITTSTHNAMYLVSERFNVKYSDIIELAPFLFCWAAEASLRQRQERLQQAEFAHENAQKLEREVKHLRASDTSSSEEKIAAERASIEQEDLFGLSLDCHLVANDGTHNPFALFLRRLTKEMRQGTIFDEYSFMDYPGYRICTEEATHYADGDTELADEILEGRVALNAMPQEIRENWERRAQWVREKAEHHRNEMLRLMERSRIAEASK
jgi:transcriptional regulator with XRE-family HTH domain